MREQPLPHGPANTTEKNDTLQEALAPLSNVNGKVMDIGFEVSLKKVKQINEASGIIRAKKYK